MAFEHRRMVGAEQTTGSDLQLMTDPIWARVIVTDFSESPELPECVKQHEVQCASHLLRRLAKTRAGRAKTWGATSPLVMAKAALASPSTAAEVAAPPFWK